MGGLLLLTACASGDYAPGPAPPATTTTLAPEVTVRGAVGVFSPSAQVVALLEPVSGIANVALTAGTEVVRASGAKAAITDLMAGAAIEVSGRRSTPETLVARRVVLL